MLYFQYHNICLEIIFSHPPGAFLGQPHPFKPRLHASQSSGGILSSPCLETDIPQTEKNRREIEEIQTISRKAINLFFSKVFSTNMSKQTSLKQTNRLNIQTESQQTNSKQTHSVKTFC